MNENSTVLLLLIVGVWFFTNPRSRAFIAVVKSPKATATAAVTSPDTSPAVVNPDYQVPPTTNDLNKTPSGNYQG